MTVCVGSEERATTPVRRRLVQCGIAKFRAPTRLALSTTTGASSISSCTLPVLISCVLNSLESRINRRSNTLSHLYIPMYEHTYTYITHPNVTILQKVHTYVCRGPLHMKTYARTRTNFLICKISLPLRLDDIRYFRTLSSYGQFTP